MTDGERVQRVVEPTVDIDLVARMALDLARRPGRAGSEIIRAEWLAGALRDVAGPSGPEVRIQRLGESRANVLIGPPTGPTLAFASHLDTSLSGEPAFDGRITGRRDPPRPPEIRDGVLWGLGMGVATAITVASALTALAVHRSMAASGGAGASVGALITAGGTHRDLPPWPASDAGSTPDGTAFGVRAALETGFRPGAVINAKGGAPGPLHEEPGSLYLAVEYREPWGPVLLWPVAESLRGAPARLGAVLEAIDRWRREHLEARSGRPGPGADVGVGAIDAGVPAKPDLIPATARLFLHVVLVPGDTSEEIAASLASTLRADGPRGHCAHDHRRAVRPAPTGAHGPRASSRTWRARGLARRIRRLVRRWMAGRDGRRVPARRGHPDGEDRPAAVLRPDRSPRRGRRARQPRRGGGGVGARGLDLLARRTLMNAVDELLAGLHAASADLVATLPDSWLAPALTALDASPGVDLVRVAREEDGIGLCAGAWLGGRRALMLCQNAGLLVSVNALAALAHHHQIPVVVVAADRGGLEDGFFYQAYKGRVTCPVLDAIGTPWHRVDSPDGFRLLPSVFRQAELHRRPVVMLATRAALLGESR